MAQCRLDVAAERGFRRFLPTDGDRDHVHAAIDGLLKDSTAEQCDALRGRLAIGLHHNVEVTDVAGDSRRLVSQAYCSGLPVGYSQVPRAA